MVPLWTIFTQTLIDDFDTLNWLNPCGPCRRSAVAMADSFTIPRPRGERSLLESAVVVIRYDNGAIAVVRGDLAAAYGYDVRGEVLGLARHGHPG